MAISSSWATARAKTSMGKCKIQALVMEKVIGTETSVKRASSIKNAKGTEPAAAGSSISARLWVGGASLWSCAVELSDYPVNECSEILSGPITHPLLINHPSSQPQKKHMPRRP
ncbi:hypothetical protein Tco_0067115 [Tanacetum coccineum]